MLKKNAFKSWIINKKCPIPMGSWLMAAAPATAEAMGHVGFDFLVIDMEHVPIEFIDLAHILRAIGCTPAQAVVRLAANDPILIKRALDLGARNLMLPFVQNAHEAQAAAKAMRYPPIGTRGVAAVHRASHYGTLPDYLQQANEGVCTIVQLETPQAIDSLAEIAAVEGVDALFVGPGDLSAAMGHIGNIAHERVQSALEKAAHAAHAIGKPVGIVAPNPTMAQRFITYGYDYVAVASDLSMMTGRASKWLGELRGNQADSNLLQAAY